MKSYLTILLAAFAAIFIMHSVSADMYTLNFTNADTGQQQNALLLVQVLKYDPFPVNAGDWFDLWVKVQNVGQNDAPDAVFTLQPEYPFELNDSLVLDYGKLYGTLNAYKVNQDTDASQVILKYRVRVMDNAAAGTSSLKLEMRTNGQDNSALGTVINLPIEIAKTKTDFDVVYQSSTTQGVSFGIANTGSNDATAVTVSVEPQPFLNTVGASSSIIGNLAKGDFTTVTFQISALNSTRPQGNFNRQGAYNGTYGNFTRNNTMMASPSQVTLDISYTDSAGVRNTVQKTVQLSLSTLAGSSGTLFSRGTSRTTSSTSPYLTVIAGIVIGIFLVFVYNRFKRKK